MRWRWLSGPGPAPEVVVVFGGWAAGAAPLAHLRADRDVLFVEGWDDLGADLPPLAGYGRRSLVAWSFGVAAYAHWQAGREDIFDRRVAICGSPVPVDRRLGIPPAIFARTRDRLDPATLDAFLDRAGAPRVTAPDIAALCHELDAVAARGPAPAVDWDAAVIATRDHVFPAANLRRVFAERAPREIDAPHCPFGAWAGWDEVLA
ncbi:putative biotin synthesis protein BioC [Limimaricola hongkongensis DSM 17492]|uniref:Putative biotin synthesis protein BioC n=1 Tax=Limimaricola hongkongensis DSM 17492 TaxID=1122180 RepID=A0A017HGQ6_9RHOB|nr:pimeloyl-ACP methyl esterase BioG family protein [Limimaricola hongkongensis]EYD73677.1 putative biotin synthesis protein BioC [Limimaricola hongkongensis DSM 17492]